MIDVINQDYVRTARAKGLKEKTVIYRHAFKNALIPLVTLLGPVHSFPVQWGNDSGIRIPVAWSWVRF